MSDYEPLDLSLVCNAGLSALGENVRAPVGQQTFHGLPFQIGASGSGPCFIAFDGKAKGVTIPIGKTVRWVIVAHRLLESDLLEGGLPGKVIAEYVFRLSGGGIVRIPIRERFEIGVVPADRTGAPFRSVPDQNESLLPRYEGPWGDAGRRQTEATRGGARGYYLWVWENRNPDREVEALEVAPKGARFLIAAVTLGHLDEHPFVRQGKREARVVLTDPAEAGKPFDLDVTVDRGAATYIHALPEASAEAFLGDPQKGWGEAQNPKRSPAYVEVAAIPSATVTVKQGEEAIGSVRWGEVEEKGAASTPRVRVELVDRGRNWVHVTVLDDETGKPAPCRVHFRSPEGIPYQPHGHHNQVNSNLGTWHMDVGGDVRLGQITYAYIDGTCQGWLPRGEVIVDVARGFEYEPLRERVTIQPGQRELVLRLRRWTNMNRERYFSGDTHVHFLSTQGAHTEAMGEDLNVVNLLQSQWGHLFTNTEEFIGRPTVSPDGGTIVYATQENRQHLLGHLTLLGLKRPVMPWCSDGPGEAELGGTLDTTLCHWADACHAQGGTVILPHIPTPNGEPAALIATGRVDGVEFIRHEIYQHLEYYRYLNCGYRLPIVGGTDKMSSEVPVGLYRTYVHIPDDQPFTYDTWCENLKKGNTFHSGGPIIRLTVDGLPIGSTLHLPGAGGTVEVEASAESVIPIHTLEVVQEGRVVASTEDQKGARRLHLKAKVKVEKHAWLAARCGGPSYAKSVPHHDTWRRNVMAHTSPVYLAVGGEWWMFDAGAANYMLTLIDGSLSYIRRRSPQRPPESVTHHHGEADHMAYLERPFLEAREAIHRRMHQYGIPH